MTWRAGAPGSDPDPCDSCSSRIWNTSPSQLHISVGEADFFSSNIAHRTLLWVKSVEKVINIWEGPWRGQLSQLGRYLLRAYQWRHSDPKTKPASNKPLRWEKARSSALRQRSSFAGWRACAAESHSLKAQYTGKLLGEASVAVHAFILALGLSVWDQHAPHRETLLRKAKLSKTSKLLVCGIPICMSPGFC